MVRKPALQLKAVKTFRGMEGEGFNATLYIDGIKTAFVIDSAQGGCYDYEIFNKEKFEEFKKFVESLPSETVTEIAGTKLKEPFESKPDMDSVICDLLSELEREKTKKKMDKLMQTCILVGVPGGESFKYYKFKKPLASVPKEVLLKNLEVIKGKMKQGEQILNTNLNALLEA